MADPNNESDENTTPPPTEEEKQTETVDDEIKPKEPEPEPDQPDVSARLDSIEKELAALKAMMDTLGYTDPIPSNNDDDGGEMQESIEDLFD
jgi:hypothetical protein|nr:MAG TPA_asm: hypothetical protein [Caudoviricetes sp.]